VPNTNVVFELGYAARHLGFKALVGVVNEAFGKVEGQVFDIKRRACLKYSAEASDSKPDLKRIADKLTKELEKIIRGTIQAVIIPKRAKAAAEAIDPLREEQLARARAGQQDHITALCKSLEKEFAGLIKEYLASNQGASKSDQRAPAYYECMIWPSSPLDKPVIDTLAACRSTLQHCQVGPSSSPLPDISHSTPSVGQDWIGGRMNNYGLECWRFSQQAVFAMIFSTREAVVPSTAQPGISLEDMLFRLTQVFRFTKKLAEKTMTNGSVDVTVGLRDIGNRPLFIEGIFPRLHYSSGANELSYSHQCSPEELKEPDQLAVKAAYWFCERFNWQSVTEASLANVQAGFLHLL
jgi:hypothetical protein